MNNEVLLCEECENYMGNLPDGAFDGLTAEQVLACLVGLCAECGFSGE